MEQPNRPENSVAEKERTAQHVLQAYRERRRRRRADDTYFGSADLLLAAAEAEAEGSELHLRQSEIMNDAALAGMPPELAEKLYDIAREEGLDPRLGFELVRTGLGVAPPPEGVSNAAAAPATDKYLPTWFFPAEPTDELLRERMLRFSFRRLRSFLEGVDEVEEAFRLFANEPDVGHFGY